MTRPDKVECLSLETLSRQSYLRNFPKEANVLHYTILESLARIKFSCLLVLFISYDENEVFANMPPGQQHIMNRILSLELSTVKVPHG